MIYTDQLGNILNLNERPKRVISLVPSQSEFLWDIGLRQELVGISKFCIHPNEMFRTIERIGGTKDLDLDKIRALKPDLIIGNKEENERGQIETLQKEFNVWMSDIYTFDDAIDMMQKLGDMLDRKKETALIVDGIRGVLPTIKNCFAGQKVAYFIWNKPYMFAANHTFIGFVLNYIGLNNVLQSMERYPELSIESLRELNPAICLLSSEPFPFVQKHIEELEPLLPESKFLLADGEMFSWYGSRLRLLPAYIQELKEKLELPLNSMRK